MADLADVDAEQVLQDADLLARDGELDRVAEDGLLGLAEEIDFLQLEEDFLSGGLCGVVEVVNHVGAGNMGVGGDGGGLMYLSVLSIFNFGKIGQINFALDIQKTGILGICLRRLEDMVDDEQETLRQTSGHPGN